MTMLRLLIADPIHAQGKSILESQGSLQIDTANGLSESELSGRIGEYDALIVRSKTKVTAPSIAAAKKLRIIGRAGIGVDNIDMGAATEHGIVVVNTPDSNATTTAELAVAHLLSLSRNLPQADRSVRAGEWQPAKFMGAEVTGKTVGIIGFGTIGRIFASRCQGLKLKVLAYDPAVTPQVMEAAGVEAMALDELLKAADYISLHCPLIDQTRNLIDARRLALMKPGARIINCARGGLIDEAALYDAVKSGKIAGAALDVFASEPPKETPLFTLPNIVMTPHLGASTEEAQQAVSVKIAEDIAAFLKTGVAANAVNLPKITAENLSRTLPYQALALSLGRLIGALAAGPVAEFEIGLFGRAAELDPRPVTAQALVGLLGPQLAVSVNQVNAPKIAQRQGIVVRETRSDETHDYVSLIEIRANAGGRKITVAGTLLGDRHPRVVRIDGYEVEAVPDGHMLFTRHEDRPGVVGALGGILGRESINISRMQIGVADNASEAISLIGISRPLPAAVLDEVRAHPAIKQAVQISI